MPATADQAPLIQRLVASRAVRSGYASAVAHVLALIALALLVIPVEAERRPRPIRIRFAAPAAAPGTDGGDHAVAVAAAEPRPDDDAAPAAPPAPAAPQPVEAPPPPDAAPQLVAITEPAAAEPAPPSSPVARPASLSRAAADATAAHAAGDPFAARRGAARGAAARGRGGSAASEAAVDAGLAWLAAHQGEDGSWRCDLSNSRCAGACRDPGTMSSTTAATGLALLPFLGAGHTHVDGDDRYRDVVGRALYYLLSRLKPTPRGGDLAEGTMYGQGVATLALAEALGMTRDDMLTRPVNEAVKFIVTAQDAYGGGWRYLPGQSGDTTVTAWQLTALKSAALAGAAVPSPTIDGVRRFLDRVQARGGEAYGYQGPQALPCTSAIGLFCRLHTGWDRPEALERGLAALARAGPDPQAVYTNFYLAQALLQANHAAWPRWNRRNRDQIVALQARIGHEQGSWFFADPETAPGGRLAHTALAVLTLEVYYRLLPVYRPEAVEREW